MKFAITPCPNDTFSYYALISGAIKSNFEFVFEDIETLNIEAVAGKYPVTKMSFAQYLSCSDKYELLDVGAALGVGTGPVLVGRPRANFADAKEVLVPGMNTTGALLLARFCNASPPRFIPMHFRRILEKLSSGEFDFGVLIHEGRFIYRSMGLKLIVDLGDHWTKSTGLPVPLGCICVRRDFSAESSKISSLIKDSIKRAFANPIATYDYVASKAQYLDSEVLKRHIYAFVNEYSLDMANVKSRLIGELEKCRK